MKLFNKVNNVTETLATTVITLDAARLKGYMLDVKGEYGYNASAKDMTSLMASGWGLVYGKLLINVIGHAEIRSIAITKLLGLYSISIVKHNGLELHSDKVTKLINLVLNPRKGKDELETGMDEELVTCIKKAVKEGGKNATVKNVFNRLNREAYFSTGTLYRHYKDFTIRFNKSGPVVTVTVTDGDGFRRDLTSAMELQSIIS